MTNIHKRKNILLKKFERFSDQTLKIMISSIYQLYMLEKKSYLIATNILKENHVVVIQDPIYSEIEDRYRLLKSVCELRGIVFEEKDDVNITIENVVIELRTILQGEIDWIKKHSYVLDSFETEGDFIITEEDLIRSKKEQYEDIIRKLTPQNMTLNLK